MVGTDGVARKVAIYTIPIQTVPIQHALMPNHPFPRRWKKSSAGDLRKLNHAMPLEMQQICEVDVVTFISCSLMHYDAMTISLIYLCHGIHQCSSKLISVEELLGPVDQGPPVLHLIGASARLVIGW